MQITLFYKYDAGNNFFFLKIRVCKVFSVLSKLFGSIGKLLSWHDNVINLYPVYILNITFNERVAAVLLLSSNHECTCLILSNIMGTSMN